MLCGRDVDDIMTERHHNTYFIVAIILVIMMLIISICAGKYPLSGRDIMALLFGEKANDIKYNVFYTLRVPRSFMVLLAGVGLGMAASVFQLIFKNPLAAPDIIGVSSGANLGAALAIVLFGHSTMLMATSAFVGGILVVLMVITLAQIVKYNSTQTYILAGIIVKAISEAIIMVLKFYADPEKELAAIEFWSMGSFGNITAAKIRVIFPIFMIGFIGLILMNRQLPLLGLNEDESRMLGVRVKTVRIIVLTFSTMMVAAIICLTGLITFVGLISAHIARLILKRVSFSWCMLSALIGALILLVADCLARSIYSVEMPISILTTLIGVLGLIYIMFKRKAVML